jgi:BirA family biotin operon repressor/biotin-[acetyl-CoA-carboxylase] ligase
VINETQIRDALKTRYFGQIVHSFNLIDSTNTYAKSLIKENGPHGTVVLAEEQSAGRGRMQRNWSAEKGKNLLFSIVLYPDFGFEKISLLPFAASLAVADAIDSVNGLSSTCKWPNDVLINGKKVCGMLLEAVSGGEMIEKVVLGIGINVNQVEFPEELRHKATSLSLESGIDVDRIRLLQSVLEECEHRYEQLAQFPPMQLLNEWKLKALLFGKKITVLESEFSYNATAIDLAEDGSLIIKTEDGTTKSIFAGDVSLAYI